MVPGELLGPNEDFSTDFLKTKVGHQSFMHIASEWIMYLGCVPNADWLDIFLSHLLYIYIYVYILGYIFVKPYVCFAR